MPHVTPTPAPRSPQDFMAILGPHFRAVQGSLHAFLSQQVSRSEL